MAAAAGCQEGAIRGKDKLERVIAVGEHVIRMESRRNQGAIDRIPEVDTPA
jgi:hypothetical protein